MTCGDEQIIFNQTIVFVGHQACETRQAKQADPAIIMMFVALAPIVSRVRGYCVVTGRIPGEVWADIVLSGFIIRSSHAEWISREFL